jgi:hypothetical protein
MSEQHRTPASDLAAPLPIIVRAGSDGEALVTYPCGRMRFMGLWGFISFAWEYAKRGQKIEVQDDR